MKSLIEKFSNICIILSLFVLSSCGGNKTKRHSKDISYIKPPEWVQNAMGNSCFSAVGVSNREGGISKAQKYAKNNAVDNLKTNIIVKFENLFLEEARNIPDNDKIRLLVESNDILKSQLTNDNLMNISQVYDTWKSPNSNVLYVKVVADEKQVAYLIINALDTFKSKYKNNNTIVNLVNRIKNDALTGNFKNSKMNGEANNINQNTNNGGITIKNIVISKNSDGSPLSNSTADWTKQDDEIDKQIRKAIEISEREEIKSSIIK